MEYNVLFQYMYTICNYQIRAISISITSDIYHFFVLEHLKSFLLSCFEIYNKVLLTAVTVLCYRVPDLLFTGVWIQGFSVAGQTLLLELHSVPFCSAYFGNGVLQTLCLGWPQTTIPHTPQISASQVANVTGVSYQCLAALIILESLAFCTGWLGP
jgi:hypothetical protein